MPLSHGARGRVKRRSARIRFRSPEFEIPLLGPQRGVGWAIRSVRLRKMAKHPFTHGSNAISSPACRGQSKTSLEFKTLAASNKYLPLSPSHFHLPQSTETEAPVQPQTHRKPNHATTYVNCVVPYFAPSRHPINADQPCPATLDPSPQPYQAATSRRWLLSARMWPV